MNPHEPARGRFDDWNAPLFGRSSLLDSLERGLRAGKTLLLYGPVGVGKSAILQRETQRQLLAHPLRENDVIDLVQHAEGLAGRAIEFAEALTNPHAWQSGQPRFDWLRTQSVIRAAERYTRPMRLPTPTI